MINRKIFFIFSILLYLSHSIFSFSHMNSCKIHFQESLVWIQSLFFDTPTWLSSLHNLIWSVSLKVSERHWNSRKTTDREPSTHSLAVLGTRRNCRSVIYENGYPLAKINDDDDESFDAIWSRDTGTTNLLHDQSQRPRSEQISREIHHSCTFSDLNIKGTILQIIISASWENNSRAITLLNIILRYISSSTISHLAN